MDNLDLGKKKDLMENDFDLIGESKQVLVDISNLFFQITSMAKQD
jgi:hypothetical protein